MKSNATLKSAHFLALFAIVSLMAACPEPSAEEREKHLIDRAESQISDNNGVSSDKLCANQDDKKHIYRSNHDFAEKWYECSETVGWLPPAARLKLGCMKEVFTNMTDQCLDCFSKMTACTASNCWGDCMNDSKGTKCQDCAVKQCSDEMFQCSGISAIEIPDFRRD